jgi:hypothetical protein
MFRRPPHALVLGPMVALLALLALLALSGCAGDEDVAPAATPAGPTVEEEAADERVAEAGEPSAGDGSPLPVDIPDEPLASAPAQREGMFLDVYALHRSGRTVNLVFGLRNETPEGEGVYYQFGSGVADMSVAAVTLFDAQNLKRHLVFRDDEDRCICSRAGGDVEAGETMYFSAAYPAPPADVVAMTVQTPIGSVPDVPLTDG